MFATVEGTVDQALERRREARRCELRLLCEQEARSSSGSRRSCARPTTTGIGRRRAVPRARSGWRRSQQRLPHRRAHHAHERGAASLPALDHALSSGALTLDQVAAAAEYATPATDAELARVAVGKAPSAIALAARTLAPPAVEDDQELYERRALSMTWTRGRRELASAAACRSNRAPPSSRPSGTSPSPNAPPTSRPAACSSGSSTPPTRSSPSPASRRRRRRHPAQPHNADRAPQRRPAAATRRRRPDQPRDSRAAHLRRPPPHDQAERPRPRALARRTLRLLPAATRAPQALSGHCQYPGCTATRELEAHHLIAGRAWRRDRARQPHPALPPPPQTPPRPPHPHKRQRRAARLHRPDRTRDHHQPATRTARLTPAA